MPNLIHVAELLGGGLGCILLGWVLRWGQHRADCRANLEDEGRYQYDRGWDDNQRRHDKWARQQVAAAMLEEAAEDMAGPVLLTDTHRLPAQPTEMSDAEYAAYASAPSHVINAELAALAVPPAIDVPRPEQVPDHERAVIHGDIGPGYPDRHPDDWGDDTALDAFRQYGTWEEQLAAIDASLGDSPWWTARQREMAA